MRAVSVWPPWSYAITCLGKRCENRSRMPPRGIRGKELALHATLKEDRDAYRALRAAGYEVPTILVKGAVVGVVTISGYVRSRTELPHEQRRWWIGPVGWVLSDVVALAEPIPCRGQQGIWTLPDAVEAEVRRQLVLEGRESR